MKRSHVSAGTVGLLLILVAVASQLPAAESVTCSPYELVSCYGAFFGSDNPSGQCCSKLTEQRPCLCTYLRDPNLRSYVNSPNAHRVAAVCKVSYPQC